MALHILLQVLYDGLSGAADCKQANVYSAGADGALSFRGIHSDLQQIDKCHRENSFGVKCSMEKKH